MSDNMTELIFMVQVGIGIIIMATNVVRYWSFMKKMTNLFAGEKGLKGFATLGEVLLIGFLLGYIVVFFTGALHDLVVAGILLGGSIYVCIMLTILFQMVKTILYQLKFDAITDLPNRMSLHGETRQEEALSVAIIDINDFKFINEKYGHAAGDAVLRAVADRLRKNPEYRPARIGADEFLIQFDGDIAKHPEIGSRIHRTLGEPIDYSGNKIIITCSIGCATRRGSESLEELITEADIAMYRAKQEKTKKFWVHYSEELGAEIDHRRQVIEDLDAAIRDELFGVVYQPQVVPEDRRLCGFEVLCRFPDDLYLPEEFIPVAEETEQIIAIGRLITKLAIRQLKIWRDEGLSAPVLFINYSAIQLKDPGYCEYIGELLKKYHISPDRIKLEITERIPMGTSREVTDFFRQTRELGIELALDDFGTGYSSVGAVMDYPVGYVKLDRTVIEKYLHPGNETYIRHIVDFAHDLGKKLVAEGVETREQLEMAMGLGIDEIQGFYFSKPLLAEEAKSWIPRVELK